MEPALRVPEKNVGVRERSVVCGSGDLSLIVNTWPTPYENAYAVKSRGHAEVLQSVDGVPHEEVTVFNTSTKADKVPEHCPSDLSFVVKGISRNAPQICHLVHRTLRP